jgi:hypothetical protein
VRINERPAKRTGGAGAGAGAGDGAASARGGPVTDNKKIAYLLDLENIRVVDLVTGITAATINHDSKVRARMMMSSLCPMSPAPSVRPRPL